MNLSRALPTSEPLSLIEAKQWLRIDHDDEDALVEALIQTARDQVEEYTARSLVNRVITLKLDRSEIARPAIWLPYGPVSTITSVTYYTTDDVGTVESANDYYLAGDRLVHEGAWTWERDWAAVTIVYTAGYGAYGSAVPSGLTHALRMLLSDLYEVRQSEVVGTIIARSSGNWQSYADPYRQGHLSTWA